MLREYDRNVRVEMADGTRVTKRGIWHWLTMPTHLYVGLVNPEEQTIVLANQLVPEAHGPVVMLPSMEVPHGAGYSLLAQYAACTLRSMGATRAALTEHLIRTHFAPAKSPIEHKTWFAETNEKLPDNGWIKPVPIERAIEAVYSGGITSPYTQIAVIAAAIKYVQKPRKISPVIEPLPHNGIFAPGDPCRYEGTVLPGEQLTVTQSSKTGGSFGMSVFSESLQHSNGRRFSINTVKKGPSATLPIVYALDDEPYILTREEYRPGIFPIGDSKVVPRTTMPNTPQDRPGMGGRISEISSGALQMLPDKSRLETPIEGGAREAFQEINKKGLDETEFDITNAVYDLPTLNDMIFAGLYTDEHSTVCILDAILNERVSGRFSYEAAQGPLTRLIRYGEGDAEYNRVISNITSLTQEELAQTIEYRLLTQPFLGVSEYLEHQLLLRKEA
jgi:hypothetical protein